MTYQLEMLAALSGLKPPTMVLSRLWVIVLISAAVWGGTDVDDDADAEAWVEVARILLEARALAETAAEVDDACVLELTDIELMAVEDIATRLVLLAATLETSVAPMVDNADD